MVAEVGTGGVEEMLQIDAILFMWTEMKAKCLAMWGVEVGERGVMGNCNVIGEGREGGKAGGGVAWLVLTSPVRARKGVGGS